MNGQPWTQDEDAALRRLYGTMKSDELAARIQRSKESLKGRAIRLGLPAKRARAWSAEEDAIIEREYPSCGWRHVHSLLPHRSPQAIRTRASFLGVPAKLTADDVRLIRGLLPHLTCVEIGRKFEVSRHAISAIKHCYTWARVA